MSLTEFTERGFFFVDEKKISNISSKIILDLSIEITEHLKPGGHLIVSGFLDINESEIINKFKELNLSVLSRLSTADWVALSLRN